MEEDDGPELSEKLKRIQCELGVEIQAPYDRPDKVEAVRFNFEPEVWADLANAEGDLLPRCCGSISIMRDAFIGAMRENGLMQSDAMQDIAVNMGSHDFDETHPVQQVKRAYEKLKEDLHFALGSSTSTCDLDDIREICGMTRNFCVEYWGNSIFSNWGEQPHDVASHNQAMFQMLPVLKALVAKFDQMALPPVEGYAIVRKATNEIFQMMHGLAVFGTIAEADKVLADWHQTKQIKPDVAVIKSVRISWDKGVEMLAEVETPWSKPDKGKEMTDDESKFIDSVRNAWHNAPSDRMAAIMEDAFKKMRLLSK
jgi:hypothetical protein